MSSQTKPAAGFPPAPSARAKGKWRWVLTVAKWTIVIIVLWAIRHTLVEAWRQLGEVQWAFRPGWLLVSAALYALGLLPGGLYWFVLLRRLGHRLSWYEAYAAYVVGGLGKYVPGKAMVVVIRAGLVHRQDVQPLWTVGSVILETLTMMSVGAFWAACLLALQVSRGTIPPAVWLLALGLFAITLIPTLPGTLRPVLWLLRRVNPAILSQSQMWVSQVTMGTLALGWLLMSALWFCWGLSFLAALAGTGQVSLRWVSDLGPAVAAIAFATVAGFAVIVIPGGIGVREAALAELTATLLAHRTPHPELAAVATAALLRLVWVLTELALAGIFMVVRPKTSADNP